MRQLRRGAAVLSAAALLLTALTFVAGPAQADVRPHVADLSNGGFESPVVPTSTPFVDLVAGQTIGPWTVGGDSVDLNSPRQWDAAEKQQSLDLNGSAPGSVTQTISTFPLTTYVVTFQLAGNPDGGPAVKTGVVEVDGSVVADYSFDVRGHSRRSMGYVEQTVYFTTLLDTSVGLTFASSTNGAYGPVIDDVQVSSCLLVICL